MLGKDGRAMLASIKQDGLKITITPGLSWDEEQKVFKGSILYGDEILTLCVSKERMQRSINACFEIEKDIEELFDIEEWVLEAENPHDPDVYFEDEDDLGPE